MHTRFTFFLIVLFLISCKKESPSPARTRVEVSVTPENWMRSTLLKYSGQDIALADLAVPGSHDAGLYVTNLCSFGANSCNTQTQYLPMKQQLEAGIRIFDLRPCLANGKYFTQHVTDCGGLGCKGDLLTNIFTQTNDFLNNHGELVIYHLTHFCGMNYNDSAFMNLLTRTFGDKIYKETSVSSIPFIQQPLRNIIPTSINTGKVMLIFDDDVSNTATNRANGLFAGSILPIQGGWTNSHSFADLKVRQLANYADFVNDRNSLFQFSWQVTQDETQAITCFFSPTSQTSIENMAIYANKQLPAILDTLIMNNDITKGRIPNIIYFDFADEAGTQQCLRLNSINLE